ncbi:MAG: hypothetical protein J7497_06070, partial [Chitinophagaceae bacterium]|nr:hypothetical protein [Chitinophagaceae bacterium]
MKSRHKITLLFTLLVTTLLLAVSFSVYYFSALERQSIFKKRLSSRANKNAQILSYVPDTNYVVLDKINMSTMELLPEKSVEIYTPQGTLFYRYKP